MTDLALTSSPGPRDTPTIRSPLIGLVLLGFSLLILLTAANPLAGIGDGAWKDRAASYERHGDLDSANQVYRDRLARDHGELTALRGLAVNLTLMQRHDEALAYQERVVDLDLRDAQTRVELAFNYLNHQKRPDAAVRPMREAVEITPSAKHHTFLAQALISAGRATEAREELRSAIEAEATYKYSYEVLHRLLIERGDLAGARTLRAEGHDRARIDLDAPPATE